MLDQNTPLVSIIIVNWNGQKDLTRCLTSLASVNFSSFEIILVDNGSTDQSISVAKDIFPQIIVVENGKNLGFAEANNIGLRKASGQYILFLNNDTEVTADFLTILVSKLGSDEKIGCVQPKIYLLGRGKILDAVGSYLTPTGFLDHFGYEQEDKPEYNKEMKIFSAKGACMLFRRSVLDVVDAYDSDYFAYFEETDLCWRTWLAGFLVLYVPQAVVFHKGGATTHRLHESFALYHSYKNRLRTLAKNLGGRLATKILAYHLAICTALAISYLVLGRFSQSWAIVRALWWNVKMFGSTLEKRRVVQTKLRRVDDSQLFGPLMRHHALKDYYDQVYFSFFVAPRIRQEKMKW